MHKLYELKEKLIDELEAYSENGKYSKEDVEAIKYMASAVDHICNIVERADDEYSMSMGGGSYESYARGGGGGGRSRGSGRSYRGSYARGRSSRRDSMGRYSSEGYSRAEDFKAELRDIMNEAPNEQVRMEIQSIISKMDNM